MNADRLDRIFVNVDVTDAGSPALDPVHMAIISDTGRPQDDLSEFLEAEVVEATARLLVAMSADAADTTEDKTLTGPGDYGIWIWVDGAEQIVRKAGTLTVA